MGSALKLALAMAALCWLAVFCLTDQASAAATVSLQPHITYATPGQTIRIFIWKDLSDTLFDGYETVIRFNPSELQLLLGAAEESVMTKNCDNRWWYTNPGSGTVLVSHVRMCPPNTVVSGPGALSSLSFKVLREGRLVITCDYFWFTRAGYWIKDVAWQDGIILSGATAGLGDGATAGPGAASIEVCPNPGREMLIRVYLPAGSGHEGEAEILGIYNVEGCLVQRECGFADQSGVSLFTWNGTDLDGHACSPGMYYLSFGSGSSRVVRSAILVR